MNSKLVILAVVLLILAGGGYFLYSNQQSSPATDTPDKPNLTPAKNYTLADIETHNSADDCWMIIEGKVYDLTKYVAFGEHPGGKTLLGGCGLDGTNLFRNEPPHSEFAEGLLADYYIGDLQ